MAVTSDENDRAWLPSANTLKSTVGRTGRSVSGSSLTRNTEEHAVLVRVAPFHLDRIAQNVPRLRNGDERAGRRAGCSAVTYERGSPREDGRHHADRQDDRTTPLPHSHARSLSDSPSESPDA